MTPGRSLAALALVLLPYLPAAAQAPEPDPAAPPGGWEAAEQRLRTAIRLNPEGAALHAALAEALRRQDRLDEAVESYRRAVTLQPLSGRYRGGFAFLLLDARQWERAELHFRQAIRLDSARAELHAGLGEALRAQGLHPQAAEAYRRAVVLSPDDPRLQELLARAEDASAAAERPGPLGWAMRLVRLLFAASLGAAGLVLLVPTLCAAYLLVVLLPLDLLRRR